jgi:hypothetical protein
MQIMSFMLLIFLVLIFVPTKGKKEMEGIPGKFVQVLV